MKRTELQYRRDTGENSTLVVYMEHYYNHRKECDVYYCSEETDEINFNNLIDGSGDLRVYSEKYVQWLEEQLDKL